jgi:hypothetical protein
MLPRFPQVLKLRQLNPLILIPVQHLLHPLKVSGLEPKYSENYFSMKLNPEDLPVILTRSYGVFKKPERLLTKPRITSNSFKLTQDASERPRHLIIPILPLEIKTNQILTQAKQLMLLFGPNFDKSCQMLPQSVSRELLTNQWVSKISRRYLISPGLGQQLFHQTFLRELRTCRNILRRLRPKVIWSKHGDFDKSILQKRLVTLSSISCSDSQFLIPFHDPSGKTSCSTNMLTSKSFMPEWIEDMIMTMNRKTLQADTRSLRRTTSERRNQFSQSLIGYESRVLGSKESSCSILIGSWSLQHTWKLLMNSSVRLLGRLQLLFVSMLRHGIDMLSDLLGWTIAIRFRLPSLHKCSVQLHHLLVLANVEVLPRLHQGKNLIRYAGTGTLGIVTTTNALTREHMDTVMNVEALTEQRIEKTASKSSRKGDDNLDNPNLQKITSETKETRSLAGERGTKRKASDFPEPPLFRRRFVWSRNRHNKIFSPSAAATEFADPLPSPPESLLNDPEIQSTLNYLDQYIKVETPFNVDRFENLLIDHPNQPFVKSVMKGLREGFWPFDEGEWDLYSKDYRQNYSDEDRDLAAIRAFRDKEVGLGRWSTPLPDLSIRSGMKISPLFVVWQHEKPRIITDHAGSGLNDGIPREEAHVQYDDMRTFSQALYDAIENNPLKEIITYKSDIASAFLNLPAHPLWQIRQIVIVDAKGHVVRRLVFGNRGSPRCWCSVSGLICWIGIVKLDLVDLHVYMDDFFGWDYKDNCIWFHNCFRPRRQVQLLILWDFISVPYEDKKQEHGITLKIIGFWVNSIVGSISLTPDSIADMISKINLFIQTDDRQPPLREWLKLAGHLNWMLNVLPWGRPALSEIYRKTAGKLYSHGKIFLNATVVDNLTWLAKTIPSSIGIRFVDVGRWNDEDADLVMWTDASGKYGLSFVYAGNGFVYQLRSPKPGSPSVDIFFLELLAILSGIHHVANFPHPPRRLLIHTDSLDSVAVLNTLRASEPLHNSILIAIAEIMMKTGIDLRVRHIEGKQNIRADMLSRLLFVEYHRLFPADRVRTFSPPRTLLPARWNESF